MLGFGVVGGDWGGVAHKRSLGVGDGWRIFFHTLFIFCENTYFWLLI